MSDSSEQPGNGNQTSSRKGSDFMTTVILVVIIVGIGWVIKAGQQTTASLPESARHAAWDSATRCSGGTTRVDLPDLVTNPSRWRGDRVLAQGRFMFDRPANKVQICHQTYRDGANYLSGCIHASLSAFSESERSEILELAASGRAIRNVCGVWRRNALSIPPGSWELQLQGIYWP